MFNNKHEIKYIIILSKRLSDILAKFNLLFLTSYLKIYMP